MPSEILKSSRSVKTRKTNLLRLGYSKIAPGFPWAKKVKLMFPGLENFQQQWISGIPKVLKIWLSFHSMEFK